MKLLRTSRCDIYTTLTPQQSLQYLHATLPLITVIIFLFVYYYDTKGIGGLGKEVKIRISQMRFDKNGKNPSTPIFSEKSLDTIFVIILFRLIGTQISAPIWVDLIYQ